MKRNSVTEFYILGTEFVTFTLNNVTSKINKLIKLNNGGGDCTYRSPSTTPIVCVCVAINVNAFRKILQLVYCYMCATSVFDFLVGES